MPKPPRTEVLPIVPGDHANPTRGMKSAFGARGESNVIRPGTLAIAFIFCCVQPYGVLVYSYRTPRLRLKLGRTFQMRSEEHTSELQSRVDLVCRLLLEKKKRSR